MFFARNRARTLILAVACQFLTAIAFAQDHTLAPLPIKDAVKVRQLSDLSPDFASFDLSPDGEWLAYTLQDPWRKNPLGTNPDDPSFTGIGSPAGYLGCDIIVTTTRTGRETNITAGKGNSFLPAWSPDGERLAFYSDRDGALRIWVWEKSLRTLRRASAAIIRPNTLADLIKWTPDGKFVVAYLLPEGMTSAAAIKAMSKPPTDSSDGEYREPGSTVTVYRSKVERGLGGREPAKLDPSFSFRHLLCDLSIIDVSSGRVERLARNVTPSGKWISPDGQNIAFANAKGLAANRVIPVHDLTVVSLKNKTLKVLANDVQISLGGYAVSWSPDSRKIAYLTSNFVGGKVNTDCFTVSLDGQLPINITPEQHPRFVTHFNGPVWSYDGQDIFLTADTRDTAADKLWKISVTQRSVSKYSEIPGRALTDLRSGSSRTLSFIAATQKIDDKKNGLYKIDGTTGSYISLIEEDANFEKHAVSENGRLIAYSSQSAYQSEDIWLYDLESGTKRRVTKINPSLDRYVKGKSRVISWRGADGNPLKGALLLPADYREAKRYPLIVYQYPGSLLSDYANNFGLNRSGGAMENWQLYATRGYAVLLADVPLRPGSGEQMQEIAKAVMPGVDKAIELGIADPDRLGVAGHSSGGFGVLSLIVQTNRFAAAVDLAGPSDKLVGYSQLAPNGSSIYVGLVEQVMGGTLWEVRDRYIQNSPLFFFDKVTTPLLLIQGSSDPFVPPASSDSAFIGLRRLGKTVVYAKYAGEGHDPSHWSYANQIDYLNRMISWFDKYLKAPEKTVSRRQ